MAGTAAKSRVLSEVTVSLSTRFKPALQILGFDKFIERLSAVATARVSGGGRICMILLSEDDKKAIDISGDARIFAEECAVYSNSIAKAGVAVTKHAKLTSELTCSSGGYAGEAFNYDPLPLTDCPAVKDPLVSRATDNPTGCNHKKLTVEDTNKTLYPGVYCGDTELTDGSNIVLLPGTYVFWNGKLKVDKGTKLSGEGVSLVFIGKKAELEIKNDTEIMLSAAETGTMAGILIYADRENKKSRDFKIESRNARRMVGTIYLPNDKLTIGGDKDGNGQCDSDIGPAKGPLGWKPKLDNSPSGPRSLQRRSRSPQGSSSFLTRTMMDRPSRFPPASALSAAT